MLQRNNVEQMAAVAVTDTIKNSYRGEIQGLLLY